MSLCVDDEAVHDRALAIASDLAQGSAEALQFTKLTLNHWLDQATSILDAAAALEMLGFGGPDARRAIDALTS